MKTYSSRSGRSSRIALLVVFLFGLFLLSGVLLSRREPQDLSNLTPNPTSTLPHTVPPPPSKVPPAPTPAPKPVPPGNPTPPPPQPQPSPAPETKNVCEGLRVNDKAAHPMTALAKPAYGQAVTDPQFGTTIRRISAADPKDGKNAIVKPMYATVQAWNADESLMLLWQRTLSGRTYHLLNGKTYAFIKTLTFASTDLEQIIWDPRDPDILYYPSNYNGLSLLIRYHVSTGKSDLVHDFKDICPKGQSAGLGSDPMYTSWVNSSRILGMRCGDLDFVYDITTDKVTGGAVVKGANQAPQTAPSGNLIYWFGKAYDTALHVVRELPIGATYEHASAGYTSDGHDVYASAIFDPPAGKTYTGSLVRFDMDSGAVKVIVGPNTGYPYPRTGTHISAIAHRNSDWVGISSVGDPAGKELLDQEIVVANLVTGDVCRVAHHRSTGGDGVWGYWAEPHVVISPKGTRLIFASDWGGGSTVDTYVVELPSYSK